MANKNQPQENPAYQELAKELDSLKKEYAAVEKEVKDNLHQPLILMHIPKQIMDLHARENKAVDRIKTEFIPGSPERIKLKAKYEEMNKTAQEVAEEMKKVSVF